MGLDSMFARGYALISDGSFGLLTHLTRNLW